jgi:hypothetical protein
MKRIVLLALLALALHLAAFANDVDFGNDGGLLSYGNNALSLTGSMLASVSGLGNGLCSVAQPCGGVSFTTGALISGNVLDGATFGPGGTITIMGNGKDGVPNTVLFQGTFTGDTSWSHTGTIGVSSVITYDLFGSITGKWYTGATVSGALTQITVNTGTNGFQGSAVLGSGDIFIATPEPGTLVLLGSGLMGLAGIVRKKYKT